MSEEVIENIDVSTDDESSEEMVPQPIEDTEESQESQEESSEEIKDEPTEPEEITIVIGDDEPEEEKPAEEAPSWVKELRKAHREAQKENKELRTKLESLQTPKQETPTLGQKPKIEDFDYDADEFETALENWFKKKQEVDKVEAEKQAAQQRTQEEWNARLEAYNKEKSELSTRIHDFEDAEYGLMDALNDTQRGIIVHGADEPAKVMYAIGKNSKKAKEIAQIKDPVKFAFAVAKLEKDMKVKSKKSPPPPEKTLGGTAPKSGSVDSTLDKLRAEAERTGNYTKVIQYKQRLKSKN